MAWPALLAAALLAAAAGVLLHADRASPGHPQPGVALAAGIRDPVLAADRTLSLELRSEHLSFRYVVCIRNGRAYHGHPIIRCNVNFGDPHVEAYCSVISAGRLVTSQQDPAIPCQPDLAGSQPIMFPPAPQHQGLSPGADRRHRAPGAVRRCLCRARTRSSPLTSNFAPSRPLCGIR